MGKHYTVTMSALSQASIHTDVTVDVAGMENTNQSINPPTSTHISDPSQFEGNHPQPLHSPPIITPNSPSQPQPTHGLHGRKSPQILAAHREPIVSSTYASGSQGETSGAEPEAGSGVSGAGILPGGVHPEPPRSMSRGVVGKRLYVRRDMYVS